MSAPIFEEVRKMVTTYKTFSKRVKVEFRPKEKFKIYLKPLKKKLDEMGIKYVYYAQPDHYRFFFPKKENNLELIKELFYPRKKKKIKKKLEPGKPLRKKKKKKKVKKEKKLTPEEKIELIKEGKLSLHLKKAKNILTSCISCKYIKRIPEEDQWQCTLFDTYMNVASIYVCPYFEPRKEDIE